MTADEFVATHKRLFEVLAVRGWERRVTTDGRNWWDVRLEEWVYHSDAGGGAMASFLLKNGPPSYFYLVIGASKPFRLMYNSRRKDAFYRHEDSAIEALARIHKGDAP